MSGTEVMLLRSTDTGAPTLNGTAGSLIALLDACLKDGYNSKTPTGITRIGAVATVAFATAHGYAADGLSKVLQAGWNQTEYNGIFQISNVTTLTYDIVVTGTPATPATGSGTAKVAPCGWNKPFAGTNKAAYRSPEVTGTRLYLRVDDANPNADTNKTAYLRGYETMTDIDTGTGLFPTVAQMANPLMISKSIASDSVARNWTLVGDGFEFCFFYTAWVTTYQNLYDFFHFGDPASEMASDPYGCLIFGPTAAASTYPGQNSAAYTTINGLSAGQAGTYMARAYSQTGASVSVGKLSDYTLANGNNIFGSGGMSYPAPHNNGLYVAPVFINDPASLVRATLKCIYNPLHLHPLGHGGHVANLSNLPGRTLYAIAVSYSGIAYEAHVDITGPWR
jgi:hypothetical protein